MSDRNLSTTREQVFGDVERGTECRICGRPVTDNRSKTCSDYCDNLLSAVMGLLNWSSVRRRLIDRDNEMCQSCGYDHARERLARRHIGDRIEELAGDRPESPDLAAMAEDADEFDWDTYHERVDAWRERRTRLKERYGDPYEYSRELEVDHIQRITDGGHPFDPANLQTLCEHCHQDKTARENSGSTTPSREELNESLFDYVRDQPGSVEQ